MCNKGAILMGIFLFEATCKIQSFVRASFQKRRRMHRAQVHHLEYDLSLDESVVVKGTKLKT